MPGHTVEASLESFGVPVMLSNAQVFDAIAGRFGEVIQSAQFTENNTDLSFAVCGVLCKSVNRIQQTVALKWNDKTFQVRVEEEAGDWIPDCLVDLDEVGEEVVMNNGMDIGGGEVNNSDVIVVEQLQEPAVEVQEVHSGVQEVFLNHIQEGVRCGELRKKKGVFNRKKGARSKSKSPLGQERPKKRQRENDDPFDIDRFIFQPNAVTVNIGGEGNSEEFLTPDLNREVVLEEERPSSNFVDIVDVQGSGESVSKRLEDGLQDEVDGTVRMASIVGVTNMEQFEGHLEKEIAKEGFQTVDQ